MPLGFPLGIRDGGRVPGGDSRWQEVAAEHRAPGRRQGSGRFTRSGLSPEGLQTLRERRSRPPWPLGLGHKSTFLRACLFPYL